MLDQGSIDYMIREAIAVGIDPIDAVRMATLNTSEWFGLHDRGAIAPGRVADLVVVDDLRGLCRVWSTKMRVPGGRGRKTTHANRI